MASITNTVGEIDRAPSLIVPMADCAVAMGAVPVGDGMRLPTFSVV
jgi:hypothetical protein